MSRPFHNHKRRYRRNRNTPYIRQIGGLGKFQGNDVTSVFAYDYAMDSTDICSNEHWGNNATLVEGPFAAFELFMYRGHIDAKTEETDRLNRAERRFIKRMTGCIVHEDSQGFISVDWYEDIASLRKDWDKVERKYYPDEDDSIGGN